MMYFFHVIHSVATGITELSGWIILWRDLSFPIFFLILKLWWEFASFSRVLKDLWWNITPYHAYIHTKLAVRAFNRDSHHWLCVSFIYEWRDLQFRVDFELQIFEKLFRQIHLLLQLLPEICWKDVAKNRIFMSNKPTHYLLDYGNCRMLSIFFFRLTRSSIKTWSRRGLVGSVLAY